ncbi:MAG TPA: serine/threonine-protein kinase, partial [Anaerolineae bacterium]|nr:serine/threonine-protein kinase [Anaerolineae bacterium]
MDSLIGKRIGQYAITEFLGEGGMGVIYKAHQPSLDRDVAIKILTGPLADDEEFVARFRREAMAAGSLGHPNILTIHDAGTTGDGLHYIVMQYAPGGTLKDLVDRGPMPVERAREIAAQIADALAAAHAHGIVHRDLKPSNILLARDGRPLLTDFGVALVSSGTRLTRTGMSVGTAEYMSPEQAQGLAVDQRSDIYALGIMLYEMLAGDVPFVGDTPLATLYQHVHNTISTARLDDLGVPHWLSAVVERALAKQPEDRHASAAVMATLLRQQEAPVPPRRDRPTAAAARRVTPPPLTPPPFTPPPVAMAAPERRRGRTLLWLLIVVAAIALMAAATYLFYFRPARQAGGAGGTAQPLIVDQPTDINPERATAQAEAALEETVTALALETAEAIAGATAAAQQAALDQTAAEGTHVAQQQTATAVAMLAATVEAGETRTAADGAESTRAAEAAVAEATSLALTAEAQAALEQNLTPEAQATETAEPMPTATPTSPPPTATPTAMPTAVPLTSTPLPVRRAEVSGFEADEEWRRGDEPYGTLSRSTEQV